MGMNPCGPVSTSAMYSEELATVAWHSITAILHTVVLVLVWPFLIPTLVLPSLMTRPCLPNFVAGHPHSVFTIATVAPGQGR